MNLDQLPTTDGVYAIVNLTTNEVYIGSSGNIRRRVASQVATLRRGKHPNRYLQGAWNTHGELVFTYRVLETTTSDVRLECEARWIATYRSHESGRGYNQTPHTKKTIFQRVQRRFE